MSIFLLENFKLLQHFALRKPPANDPGEEIFVSDGTIPSLGWRPGQSLFQNLLERLIIHMTPSRNSHPSSHDLLLIYLSLPFATDTFPFVSKASSFCVAVLLRRP